MRRNSINIYVSKKYAKVLLLVLNCYFIYIMKNKIKFFIIKKFVFENIITQFS